jgi:uncharacterized protein (DUF1330 family)
MTSYAVAHMRTVDLNEHIAEYLHRIDATLDPFGGRFLIHGPELQVVEGEWPGTLIVIEFPADDGARRWYDSEAYRQIIALRTGNSGSDVVIASGVEHPHRATDVL